MGQRLWVKTHFRGELIRTKRAAGHDLLHGPADHIGSWPLQQILPAAKELLKTDRPAVKEGKSRSEAVEMKQRTESLTLLDFAQLMHF